MQPEAGGKSASGFYKESTGTAPDEAVLICAKYHVLAESVSTDCLRGTATIAAKRSLTGILGMSVVGRFQSSPSM
jgi:hypothetical protein